MVLVISQHWKLAVSSKAITIDFFKIGVVFQCAYIRMYNTSASSSSATSAVY